MRTLCTLPAALLTWAVLLSAAAAQAPPPLPGRGPSPFLFVRFAGPPGTKATFYQGRPEGRAFDGPVVVGLRPGYIYRVQLSGFTDRPGLAIYPTLEVRGTLFLPSRVNPADYPAPVVLTEADLKSALAGSLVTKVVYLEDPDKAVPAATPPNGPADADVPAGRDLLNEARDFGRPMLVVRFGGRVPPPEELVYGSVPSTILMPGDSMLPPPRVGPCLPWAGAALYDPILGPRPPTQECLHDGGDHGERAGIGPDGRLHGLDPEDTIGEYTDPAGRRRTVCSNEICLCSPRYGVLRSELPLGRTEAAISLHNTQSATGQTVVAQDTPSLQKQQYAEMKAIISREKASAELATQNVGRLVRVNVLEGRQLDLGPLAFLSQAAPQQLTEVERTRFLKQVELAVALNQPIGVSGLEQAVGTAALARVEGKTEVVSSTLETRDFTICCNEPHPVPPDKPLLLIKCADRQSAQPGDVVTFILRYSNHGGRPLTDVAVSDSLSGRLEYVVGSAQSDRDAVFTTEQNEAGSLILRWEISGRLAPGESGALRFQAKVR
ncbi:MAG TPA: hypothetical protein VMS17_33930 [Gemmataceae bacterium]|nr:hypothetical protein [Gemmataceae bacterium]